MRKRKTRETEEVKVDFDLLKAHLSVRPDYVHGRDGFFCRNDWAIFGDQVLPGACSLNSVMSMLSLTFPLMDEDAITLAVTNDKVFALWRNLAQYLQQQGAPAGSVQADTIFFVCCKVLNAATYLIRDGITYYIDDEMKLRTRKSGDKLERFAIFINTSTMKSLRLVGLSSCVAKC